MSGWQPIHHVEAEDPDAPPEKGAHTDTKPGQAKKEAKETQSPVSLSLNLPKDFISAMWGYGDQVMRLAMAVEEQNKLLREMLTKPAAAATSEPS